MLGLIDLLWKRLRRVLKIKPLKIFGSSIDWFMRKMPRFYNYPKVQYKSYKEAIYFPFKQSRLSMARVRRNNNLT